MNRFTFALLLLALACANAYITDEVKNQCDDRYGFCDPDETRVNAGYCYMAGEADCSNEGFCWVDNPPGGGPWCYYPNTNTAPDPACQVPYPGERSNCGYGPQSACEARNCCWGPLPPNVEGYWCYEKLY